ncbi:hypothetical protein AGRA3207_003738 [Actinomadura graeca]|uniref:Uncharacterized protein n=1 Tax=Actinomadura graeca TaxID=2750812 RepID=A0ABX8QZ32_9ACTN|nr:hypothetical protein [Actinomadura graeca]QXJ22692.1 hypothetical protein AGRA3207_003738 [Actinomadura graeca]
MGDTYALTLYNRSPQPSLTFAVFAVMPVKSGQRDASNVYPLVWLACPLNEGNQVTFTWTLDFSLGFARHGCQEDRPWRNEGEPFPVRYDDTILNSALLDHPNDDYTFTRPEKAHPIRPPRIYLDTTGLIPPWTLEDGPSVGLAIVGGEQDETPEPTPAIVTDSGPDLLHTFDLDPAYYIHAGQDPARTMVALDTVTTFQQVTFPTQPCEQWTLDASNNWLHGPPH